MKIKYLLILMFVVFSFTLTYAGDEFLPITTQDEFTAIDDKAVINAEPKSDAGFMKTLIDNNIIYLTIGILFAAGAFYLKLKRLRYVILLASLIFFGFYLGGCNCSVGSFMKFFYNIFTDRTNLVIFGLLAFIPVVSAFLFGRIFCGYVCPLGALQEVVAVRDKLIKITPFLDKKLRYLRIVLFALVLLLSFLKSEFIFNHISPFKAVFNLTGNYLQVSFAVLILGLSLFIYRPFCRFGCPLSLALEFAAKFSIFKVNRNRSGCGECRRCENKCPVNAVKDKIIDEGLCIRCGECLSCIKK